MSDELAQLETERRILAEALDRKERTHAWYFYIAIAVVALVVIFLVSAVLADQLSIEGVVWLTIISGILAYILTREFRYGGKAISVGEILMMLSGQMILARNEELDADHIHQMIAEYDRRIESLKAGKR